MAEKSVQCVIRANGEDRRREKKDRIDLIVYGGEIVLRKKAATAMPRERFNYLSPGSQARDPHRFRFLAVAFVIQCLLLPTITSGTVLVTDPHGFPRNR